jgi:hypothetical protein
MDDMQADLDGWQQQEGCEQRRFDEDHARLVRDRAAYEAFLAELDATLSRRYKTVSA